MNGREGYIEIGGQMMEEHVIKCAKRGDDDAFRQIIELHIHTVERFAFQLGVHHAYVDDIAQEVFIKVYRFLHKYNRGKFSTWLYKITLNVVRDFYRHEQSQKRKVQEWKQLKGESAYIDESFDEESKMLHEFIQTLDDKYKIPIILHYFHNEPFHEIAQVLGVSEGAIKTRMMRARQQLKDQFEKVGEQR